MTTLITGAGMVGTLTAQRLADAGTKAILFDVAFSESNVSEHAEGRDVVLVRGDITELSELLHAIDNHGIDRIIHTASLLTSTVNQRPVTGVKTNLFGTLSVLEAARLAKLESVVFCSANTVSMGRLDVEPGEAVTENFALRTVTEYPPTIYGTMKLASEWLSHNYEDAYGLRTISMRLGGVFGPWRGVPSGGPSRLLQHIVESAWRDQPLTLSASDLEQTMDFVYARDVAKGLVLASAHEQPPSRVYNLSGGVLYSVNEAVAILEEIIGHTIEVRVVDSESRGSYRPGPPIDISLAQAELGYRPDFPLPQALEHYVEWLERGVPSKAP